MAFSLTGTLLFARRATVIGRRRIRPHYFSSVVRTSNPNNDGAWTLLAALEKAIEAQGVKVARLVTSLEVLLPRPQQQAAVKPPVTATVNDDDDDPHTNDPAFFAFLPDMNTAHALSKPEHAVQRSHILDLLYATRHGRRIALSTLKALIVAVTWQLRALPNVITLPRLTTTKHNNKPTRVTVVGDLHGSLSDLEAVLAFAGEPSVKSLLVFNGDLADRGDHGIEVIAIVCALFLAYPRQVYINRGNHEDIALSIAYGLALEIQYKYGYQAFQKHLSPVLDDFFRSLPLAVKVEDDALIVHGGPPPPGVTLNEVDKLQRHTGHRFSKTVRQATGDDPDASLSQELILESLLWSDPSVDKVQGVLKDNSKTKSWKPNKSRGAGFRFDSNIIRDFLQREGLHRLIRSHEPVRNGCVRFTIQRSMAARGDGYHPLPPLEFFTVFSASRYPNKEGFNRGAILTLLPENKHVIRRYETEDDEPVMELSNVLTANPVVPATTKNVEHTDVDAATLRRVLSEAIASNRSQLEESLFQLALSQDLEMKDLPFHDAVDVLIDVLHLEGEDLSGQAPRLALAKALSNDGSLSSLPETIDLLHDLDECLAEQDGDSYSIHLNWLHAIFSLVDADHDGLLTKTEWEKAVATINANLPEGGTSIDAKQTWELLDFNHNGYITAAEWDSVLLDVSLTSR